MHLKQVLYTALITVLALLPGCGGGGGGGSTTTCSLQPGYSFGIVTENVFLGNLVSVVPSPVNPAVGCTTTFQASNLPAGLNIDPSSGLVSGVPTATGTFVATIKLSIASAASAGNSISSNVTFNVLKAVGWAVQAASGVLPVGPASVSSVNGQLYALVGIQSGSNWLVQLWTSSTQGTSWVNTNNPPPSLTGSLSAFSSTTDGTSLFVIGGVTSATDTTSTTYSNSVYSLNLSAAMPRWVTTTSAAFTTGGVAYSGSTYINNTLYVLGGMTSGGISNGVFSSTNQGATWQNQTTGSAPYLTSACLVAAGNKLLAIGGYGNPSGSITGPAPSGRVYSNYVPPILWSSSSPYLSLFATPEYLSCAYANGKVYVTGGTNGSGAVSNNVYSSADQGLSWVLEPSSANFAARYSHGMAVQNGKLIVVGGVNSNGTGVGDVLIGVP